MKRLIQPLLLLATLAFAAAPLITPPFMGYDPQVFPVVIARPSVQPSGYAFAIWGLIYLWLIAHAAFGLIRRRNDTAFTKPAVALCLAVVLGTVWLAIALANPITATLTILIMAATAIYAYLCADQTQDHWLLAAPMAMFAGWLTAAAAVSTGVILAGYGLLGDTGSALSMLVVVLLTALAVQISRPKTPVYGATVTWAIVGIVVANWSMNPIVAYAATAGALVMATATVALMRHRR